LKIGDNPKQWMKYYKWADWRRLVVPLTFLVSNFTMVLVFHSTKMAVDMLVAYPLTMLVYFKTRATRSAPVIAKFNKVIASSDPADIPLLLDLMMIDN